MKTISQNQLLEMLRGISGNEIITIVSITEPAQIAGSPFKGTLRKVSTVNGCAGFHYANSVNNQEKREGMAGDFVPQPRKWGHRIAGTPLVENKGKFYLEFKVERSLGHRFIDNGAEISSEKVSPFLRKSIAPATQAHLEKQVILRDYSLENILEVHRKGEVYRVE